MWMTIARAARAAGVGVETIRFYERRKLIAQPRKPASGFREYDAETVTRIRFIRQAQELGFSLREIDELLSLRADPAADCAEVRAQAAAKRDEVTQKIANLERIRAALDSLIATCPGSGALRACTILDAIEQVPIAQSGPRPARAARNKKKTNGRRRGACES
jgi:Hg(II)-responsive transcriptional regulator